MAVIDELKTVATFDGRGLQTGLKGAAGALSNYGKIANGAAVASIGLAAILFRSAQAAGDEAAAYARASNSFKAYGNSFPVGELEAFAGRMQALTGVADDQIAGFVGLLGTFSLTKQQAETLTPAILDVAEALKAQGVTAESTAVMVGKALQGGNVAGLRRVGIFVDEAKFKTDRFGAVLEALQKQGGGAAALFRQSLPGSIQAMQNSIGDAQEALGKGLVGPLTKVANIVGKAAGAFASLPEPLRDVITFIAVAAVPALAALSFAMRVAELQAKATGGALAGVGAAGGALKTLGAIGAGAAVAGLADQGLKASGLEKQGHAGIGGPEDWGRTAGAWLRRQFLGPDAKAKDAKPAQTPQEKLLEELLKAAKQTEQNTADIAGSVGNKQIQGLLGDGRFARRSADIIAPGGRA